MGDTELLTSQQTADILTVSLKTLREYVKSGELAYIRIGVGVTRPRMAFDRRDIEDFINRRRTRESPAAPAVTLRIQRKPGHEQPIYSFTEMVRLRALEKEKLKAEKEKSRKKP